MPHLTLVHSQDKNAKALGKKLAKTDKSISDGAVTKLAGKAEEDIKTYGDIVSDDYKPPIMGHIDWVVSPLLGNALMAKEIAAKGIDHNLSKGELIRHLEAIRGLMIDGVYEYHQLYDIKKQDELEEAINAPTDQPE